MQSTRPTVICVMTARSVKEVSQALEDHARCRWVTDGATLERTLKTSSGFDACIVDMNPAAFAALQIMRTQSPKTRRIVLCESCDLRMIRELLETQMAQELVYRPIDRTSLCDALQIKAAARPTRRSARAG